MRVYLLMSFIVIENSLAYVALSRATSMDDLQVMNFHPTKYLSSRSPRCRPSSLSVIKGSNTSTRYRVGEIMARGSLLLPGFRPG